VWDEEKIAEKTGRRLRVGRQFHSVEFYLSVDNAQEIRMSLFNEAISTDYRSCFGENRRFFGQKKTR